MSEIVKKLYAWCLDKVRSVAGAISAFLPRILPNRKKSIMFLKRVFLFSAMILLACPIIMRVGGSMSTGLPVFETTATYTMIGDGDKDWRLIFTSSGTITFSETITVDLFLAGGGGSGARGGYSAGGGGGYTATYNAIVLVKNTAYPIVVGSGGAAVSSSFGNGNTGGKSWCILEASYYSNGGYGGNYNSSTSPGGNGGSGGGSYNYAGGSNGGNGGGPYGGYGQGMTTREFGEVSGTLYAKGGAGNHGTLTPLVVNSGNGGNATDSIGTAGASGICVIRNHRAAA